MQLAQAPRQVRTRLAKRDDLALRVMLSAADGMASQD